MTRSSSVRRGDVLARCVLLDALEALGAHRDATILVGAQAVYLHTGNADLAVAEHTTDADLALDPALLDAIPPLEQALQDAGFHPMGTRGVGVWKTRRSGRADHSPAEHSQPRPVHAPTAPCA